MGFAQSMHENTGKKASFNYAIGENSHIFWVKHHKDKVRIKDGFYDEKTIKNGRNEKYSAKAVSAEIYNRGYLICFMSFALKSSSYNYSKTWFTKIGKF